MDARVKLPLALAFILTCALTPPGAWPVYLLLFALVMAVSVLSELGLSYVLKRAMILSSPFILAILPLPFTVSGSPLISLPLGSTELTISTPGVIRFISILAKSWISVQIAILLASTTQFPDLSYALRSLRIPPLLVSIIGLMWRYLFLIADETLRLLHARAARSSQGEIPGLKTGGTLAWRASVTGGMAGNLFVRSLERSDHIYAAMLARGYDGETRILPPPPIPSHQRLVLWVGLLLLLSILIIALLFWG